MKNKILEIETKEREEHKERMISRKEAIKKAGFMALSAATMMVLLKSPAQASSSPAPPPPANAPSGGHGPWK